MSRLNELIEKYCPDGVEYKKIKDIADVLRGKRLTKNKLSDNNEYPVFHGGIEPLGYYHESNRKADTVMVINVGASAGAVGYSDKEFWSSDGCYCISHNKFALPKFIYAALACKETFLMSKVRKAGIPTLDAKVVEGISIPVPPLPVQKEIVKTLDKFTDYVTELQAELQARRQQYEYYLDTILNFNDSVEQCKLEDVIISLNTGLNPRNFFKLNTKDAKNYYMTIREIHNGTISFDEKTDRINDDALRLCNGRSNLEKGDVIFSGTGTIGETALVKSNPINWNIKEGVYAIKPQSKKIDSLYLMYLLRSSKIKRRYSKKIFGGIVKSIPMNELKKLIIPLPDIKRQKELAKTIKIFDKLCNDISEGLPAEIEARQKQYEYYRDKLLSFKELS